MDPVLGITAADCTWAHGLATLAENLAVRRKDFDLNAPLGFIDSEIMTFPKTLIEGLRLFDPYFFELRYPQDLSSVEGVGEEEGLVLDRIVALIEPFANCQ